VPLPAKDHHLAHRYLNSRHRGPMELMHQHQLPRVQGMQYLPIGEEEEKGGSCVVETYLWVQQS